MISRINNITPIQNNMTREEAKEAIKSFASKLLSGRLIKQADIESLESIPAKTSAIGFMRNYELMTLNNGTQWVWAGSSSQGFERLAGAIYLEQGLKDLTNEGREDLKRWEAVETKCILKNENKVNITFSIKPAASNPLKNILTIQSQDFFSISRYVGDVKPNPRSEHVEEGQVIIMSEIGYTDLMYASNLREKNGDNGDKKIVIIDTEYGSFSSHGAKPLSEKTVAELQGLEVSFNLSEILGQDV